MGAKRSEYDAGKREGGKKHNYGHEEMNGGTLGGAHGWGRLGGEVQYDLEIETHLEEEDSANRVGSGPVGTVAPVSGARRNHINVGTLKDEVVQNDLNNDHLDDEALGLVKDKSIKRRENEFQRRKYDYMLSPGRADPFGEKSPSPGERTYADVMMGINNESHKRKLASSASSSAAKGAAKEADAGGNRKMRWGVAEGDGAGRESGEVATSSRANEGVKKEQGKSKWDVLSEEESKSTSFGNMPTPAPAKWVDTPLVLNDGGAVKRKKISRWDKVGEGTTASAADGLAQSDLMKTPRVVAAGGVALGGMAAGGMAAGGATPGGLLKTPYLVPGSGNFVNTPYVVNQLGNAPAMFTPMMTPGVASLATDSIIRMKIKNEMEIRNRPLTDEDLDELLPSEGYEIVQPPEEYEAIRRNKLKAFFKTVASAAGTPLLVGSGATGVATSLQGDKTGEHPPGGLQTLYANNSRMDGTLLSGTPFYELPTATATQLKDAEGGGDAQTLLQSRQLEITNPQLLSELKYVQLKSEDFIYFSKLFQTVDESDLSQDELKERKLMILLLKIKNGTPSVRRTALRAITDKVKELGPETLFNLILPLMMHNTLEDQERHLLVKVIDRILFKLDDLVRPYVHKILVVIEPLLIDEDYYARVEGREIISNLAKAAGLATMIGIMRPDIDHPDEYVRNTTARAFAVVASALGIPSLILFLKAVCQSKKNWEARHTGIKIVQQIAILMGCAVLPHLRQLVSIVAHGLHDEQQKVKTITALAIAALAEAAAPYGIEAFDSVLRPLWKGITEHRGKVLAAFLKAIGLIIPLMDPYHASYYTREVMVILINEFNSPDEEMKKVVLKCVKQCIQTEGIERDYINQEVVNPFFEKFWVLRSSHDKRNLHLIVETTVEISNKIGGAVVIARIVDDLKDPSEQFRKMVMQTIQSIVNNQGVDDIDQTLEEQLIDGILYAFQEQASEDYYVLLNSFDAIVNKLQIRMKPYLPQIAGIIRWRLNTPLPKIRQQSAELIARIANLMHLCEEHQMLGHLALYLYEYLGEEYPEVLGNIIGALKSIVVVLGVQNMTPPIKDLLPRVTPILKNRHEKVQENVIDLIGIIADKGGDLVSPKEWDRICFDLIELLKSNKKLIRRATIQTFGYIARTIGPFEVLTVLLNNLRVQERQLRVCTTVAIAIVADTCLPYSVLAALMNEYRTQDLNVQNGVLKALSFMFEYIGEIAKDYVYAVVPLLEHALMDRDLVHRQIATWACKHLALGCFGLNREDALIHLLNYVWPNIFETSPHLIQAVIDSIDGFRVALGPAIIFQYLVQGIFHPSRKVREIYWKIYNNVYIGHQDSLVPVYPPFERLADSNFARDELRYTL
ncbi:splicing factor 3B subunit 1, putative [Plasmodium vivax]|uniref:Splicing factor 3B subunit 1, putative n=1 Tax=Plasmodium vivax (strain Salvador I) TaxID=126793 RepID=A5KBA4_PLAVS|nr:splicing factor 3B subunit 1, putative [Plasmodium vivax]EDL43382.1 splicing factor 3B subunit 1, putative [Plasmodium vivax]|eukprot:XP_001613109.1 splicing factor 3B subunit 1 [Plasmodium vivax Sal-1]